MQVYTVGGAVRDLEMGQVPKDLDYVIVNASSSDITELINLGFEQVGNDFPVFLSPNGDEFALARKERKTGVGYNGFTFETENVSLKDDLGRRDITINAMAMDQNGKVYDFFGGRDDIKNRVIRHINAEAFKEDPVRVLRIARFLARWAHFTVAKETVALCKEIVTSGEMNHLTAERIFLETKKALSEYQPSRYFYFLQMIGALQVVFPEIHALVGKTQPYQHHPEGDAFIHTMMVLDEASKDTKDVLTRFCALTHDLGKGTTYIDKLPSHHGHEQRGVDVIKEMCERLKFPSEFASHAMLVSKYHTHIHNFKILKTTTIVDMFNDMRVKSNKHIIDILPMVSKYDSWGRTSFYAGVPYPNSDIAYAVFTNLAKVKLSNIVPEENIADMSVDKIKSVIRKEMIEIVNNTRKKY